MNDMKYHIEEDDDGVPFFLKILAGILASGFTLSILAVFAKTAVDVWTGECIL